MHALIDGKKMIAWGNSKLFEFYRRYSGKDDIAYLIDSNSAKYGQNVYGIEIKSPEALRDESPDGAVVVIFAVSNFAVQSILASLNALGYALNRNVILYSDLFYSSFQEKCVRVLKREPNSNFHDFAKSFSLSTKFPVHTTLLGNALFLELLSDVLHRNDPSLCLAEIGAFNCGNALLACQYQTMHSALPYIVIDSFEGFPALSTNDPVTKKSGDYTIETTLPYILDNLSLFPNAEVLKGFVPDVLERLDTSRRYGLVFYDCDLYQPALDTFAYFWDKIVPGGFMLIHDYVAEEGGFTGVKQATDEFFKGKNVIVHTFWENTMGLIIKNET